MILSKASAQCPVSDREFSPFRYGVQFFEIESLMSSDYTLSPSSDDIDIRL